MKNKLIVQEVILTLQKFWSSNGCMLMQAYDTGKGAGTINPYTFLHAIGPEPRNTVCVEPPRCPTDGHCDGNPDCLYQHHQFQIVMKPSPGNIQEPYLGSLKLLGIDPLEHDVRFVEDNQEDPSIGCAGLGWEIWSDGMEITQFTHFQQVGGLRCHPVTSEITYGLECLASCIREVESVYDLGWTQGIKYGEVFVQPGCEYPKCSSEVSNQEVFLESFDKFEKEAKRYTEESLVHPTYDHILKCNHIFNLLDVHGAVSITERAGCLAHTRSMARSVAKIFVTEREKLGFPLLNRDRHISKKTE